MNLEKGQTVTINLPSEPEYHNRKGIVQRSDTHLHEVAIKFDDKPWNVVFDMGVIKESAQQQEIPVLIELEKLYGFLESLFKKHYPTPFSEFKEYFSDPANQYHPKEKDGGYSVNDKGDHKRYVNEQPASPEPMIETVSGESKSIEIESNIDGFKKFQRSNGSTCYVKDSSEIKIADMVEIINKGSYLFGEQAQVIKFDYDSECPIVVLSKTGLRYQFKESQVRLIKKAEKPAEAKPTTEKVYSLEDVMLLSRRLHVPLRNHAEIQIVIDTQRKREKLQAELKALG